MNGPVWARLLSENPSATVLGWKLDGNRTRKSLQRLGGPLALLCLVLVWDLSVRVFSPATFILPAPVTVLATLADNAPYLARHGGITLFEMLAGLAVGALAGVVTAMAMAQSRFAGDLMMPAIVATQTLPVFAIAPLLVIWFGFGAGSKIAMAALIIYFPITSSFHDGLVKVDRQWLDLGRSWGAGRAQLLWRIRAPAALPSLATGLKIAATLAPIGAIVGEWAGASGGLGFVMLQANARMQTEIVFASLVLLAAMAFVLRKAVTVATDRLVFWQSTST